MSGGPERSIVDEEPLSRPDGTFTITYVERSTRFGPQNTPPLEIPIADPEPVPPVELTPEQEIAQREATVYRNITESYQRSGHEIPIANGSHNLLEKMIAESLGTNNTNQ